MGAVIFAKLEGENEILTRVRVGNNRKEILEQLYNITGSCSTVQSGTYCGAAEIR